ncbi:MAG TPA: hypothetical protein PLU36_04895 [Chitinophagaceae bacterium]|nr:hypothetical protein [Chitinophagaceae bacterium]HMZ46119.1 hypothetical protein [Chitinophagaceae bacterium]HNE93776.1 hypothetical protein [Chitinophagaceae bacterium]
MKIALILTGNLRSYKTAYNSLVENIIDPLQPDIFIHTWETQDANTPTWWNNNLIAEPEKTSYEDLQQMYNPQKILIEANKDFQLKHSVPSRINMPGIYSMFYGWQKGFEIMKQFEEINNFEYDIVIRTRFDILLSQKITIDLLTKCINENMICLPYSDTWFMLGGFVDTFIITNRKIAEKCICLLYNFDIFTENFNSFRHNFFIPEIYFGECLNNNGINTFPLQQQISLLRKEGKNPTFNEQLLRLGNKLQYAIFFISGLGPDLSKDKEAYKKEIEDVILEYSYLKPGEANLLATYLSNPNKTSNSILWKITWNVNKWNIDKVGGFDRNVFIRTLFQKIILKNPSKKRNQLLLVIIASIKTNFIFYNSKMHFLSTLKKYFKGK